MSNAVVRNLTKENTPDDSWIGWVSDIHGPIDHTPALKLAVECFERVGITRLVAGGDILDFNCLSSHEKEVDRVIEAGTLLEEVEPFRWFLNWMATRDCTYILGNHEGRLDRFIARPENMALYGTVAASFTDMVQLPTSIDVLPVGSDLRLGNLNMSHGDAEFKKSSGGKYPAAKLLDMVPDYSSIIGHLHRLSSARRTARDENGIARTRAAWTMPHMSIEARHYGYVSKHIGWQIGFGLIHVWWEGNKARFNVYQVEIMFDKKNRPYFEFAGRVYR